MKQITLIFIGFLMAANLMAQTGDLIIFSEDSYPFTVFLNGEKINETPESNVKITNLNAPILKARIEFENPEINTLEENVYTKTAYEIMYVIKKNKKGKIKMRFMSEVPIANYSERTNTETHTNQTTTTTTTQTSGGTNSNNSSTEVRISNNTNSGGVNFNVRVNDGTSSESLSIGFDDNQGNANVNGNFDTNVQINENQSTTTTTTTTTTTGNDPNAHNQVHNQSHYMMPGYGGRVGCPWPMHKNDFAAARQNIAGQAFDDTKLTVARQIVKANCITVDQLKALLTVFSFEDDKLEFAKFAYPYVFDQGNYFKLSDSFTFQSTIDELYEYIEAQ